MDAIVHTFNDELASLLHTKPPVTKAKMCTITKAAMKGVKFYKHIVQIVEKFIARCRPEYKVPGLYVIDSIVRQSRHQFGPDRDVYAARFARNLGITFENLFNDCLDDDKARMVRVLNLWSKNGVFDMQTIRPLLDMAEATSRSATSFQRDPKSPSSGETNTSSTMRQYHSSSKYSAPDRPSGDLLKFSKNMLDFDYGEDDDDDADETPTEAEPPLSSTLSKIEMERRSKRALNESNTSIASKSCVTNTQSDHGNTRAPSPARTTKPQAPAQDPVLERWNKIIKGELTSDQTPLSYTTHHQVRRRSRSRSPTSPTKLPHNSSQSTHKSSEPHKHHHQQNQNHNSQRGTKAESERHQGSEGASSINPERAAERERKCLPKIRDKHLTVCSSTLWLGHVPKMVSEADISDAFGEYGTINSIDLIPPRGCAFVCMDRRQDAKRALSNTKRIKLNGSYIRMAWAPGKGLKEQKNWKDYWDSDVGASYVPYSVIDLDVIDFEQLEDGGVIDEDSMSREMLDKRDSKNSKGSIDSTKINNISDLDKKLASSKPDVDSQHATTMPLFSQPPPSNVTGLQPFVVPPPPLSLAIPPPMLLTQGMMPFPPPLGVNGNTLLGPHLLPHASTTGAPPTATIGQSDSSKQGDDKAPATERKINMVEQQLNMLQGPHVQNGADLDGNCNAFYPFAQPDPMVFDYRSTHPQMLQMAALVASGGGTLLDINQAMFDGLNSQVSQPNPLILNTAPRLLPLSEQRDGTTNMTEENYYNHEHENY